MRPPARHISFDTGRLLQPAILTVAVYILLIIFLPPNKATLHAHHLSALEYRTLLFAVSIPSLVTWVAAFIGYTQLRQYVTIIHDSPDGPHFQTLARGFAWLAWSLPVSAIVYLLLSSSANKWPGLTATTVILRNYINLILPLIAFSIIGTASRGLVNRARLNFSSASVRLIMLVFLAGGVLYCFLTFQQFDLSSLSSTDNPYYLPLWLMVLSVIIPYLYAWFIGLLAAYEIMLFSRHSEGVLYRQSLGMMVSGLMMIIISLVAIQFTSTVNPGIGHLIFGYHLALTLIFRIVGGVGFVLVAIGAGRLKKIEEI